MARNEIPIRCEHTEMKAIEDLKPHPRNPNKHTDDQIKRLADIIEYQGWRRPIRVSKQSGYITAGHGALEAAKLKGWPSAPVDYQNYENTDQEYADIVADNSLHEWAGVGIDLSFVNAEMENLGPDFDVNMLGLENFEMEIADKFEDKDADSVPGNAEARCKEGDLWVLGEHRLLCGDCTVKENLDRLMNGKKADMVFTDPPYNCGGKTSCLGSDVNKAVKTLKNSEWDQDFDINPMLNNLPALSKSGCSYYIFTSQFVAPKIWEWMGSYCSFYSYLIWCKQNPMPSLTKKTWNFSSLEMICYGHTPNYYFKYPDEGHAYGYWVFTKTPHKSHPTSKPISVIEHAIIHSSKKGMLIWDGFLGSGSTLIACEKTNRTCLGMEIDPAYCNIIIERWETFTGKEAKLINGNKG